MTRQFEILNRNEKERIIEKLNEQFGITHLPFLLIKQGKERIRAYTGNLSREELETLGETINIETLGLYFCKIESDHLRLSHDSLSFLQDQITKNIIELDDEQAKEWLRGHDILLNNQTGGIVVLKHGSYLIGCGKASNGRITNFVPKDRRIR